MDGTRCLSSVVPGVVPGSFGGVVVVVVDELGKGFGTGEFERERGRLVALWRGGGNVGHWVGDGHWTRSWFWEEREIRQSEGGTIERCVIRSLELREQFLMGRRLHTVQVGK